LEKLSTMKEPFRVVILALALESEKDRGLSYSKTSFPATIRRLEVRRAGSPRRAS